MSGNPMRLLGGGTRSAWGSLAFGAAVVASAVQILGILIVNQVLHGNATRPIIEAWRDQPVETAAIACLALTISVITYNFVRLLVQDQASSRQRIDQAWEAGLRELRRHNLDISKIPFCLVIGSGDDRHEKQLFEGSEISFEVDSWPEGDQPIRWYGCREAIYLSCENTGILSLVCRRVAELADERALSAWPCDKIPPAPGPASENRLELEPESIPAIDELEAVDQEVCLKHLSRLIRDAREPACAINGVLIVLPLQAIAGEAHALTTTGLRRDLSVLQDVFRMRFPATVLVTGMEDESGFLELASRVGTKAAREECIGWGFKPGPVLTPLPHHLKALGTRACAVLESNINRLFNQVASLKALDGNRNLFRFLCRVRAGFAERVVASLVDGLGADATDAEVPHVVGCYFAGTGTAEEGNQLFVRRVFREFREHTSQLQWWRVVAVRERRIRRLARCLAVVNILLCSALFLEIALIWCEVL